jgi:amino acid transporter
LAAYIGIPIFFSLYLFWKVLKRSKWIHPADADITTGKSALDAQDDQWPEQHPRNVIEKIWFWIA